MAPSLSRGGHKEFGEGGRPRIAPYHIVRVVVHHSKFRWLMSAKGLGRVKTLCPRPGTSRFAMRAAVSGFDYARIAAISGWMPMMFITRVRL